MGKQPTITDQIFALKDEYMSLKTVIDSTNEVDPMMYPELLRIRKELSCLSLDLAKQTSQYTRSMIALRGQIELNRYKKQSELINDDQKIGKAEAVARAIDEDLKKELVVAEGLHKTGDMILKQVNEILFSLRQEISIVKKEYESYANQ